LIPVGKFPVFIIFISASPDDVDINVHPSKDELRFRDEKAVRNGLKSLIREKLKSTIMPDGRVEIGTGLNWQNHPSGPGENAVLVDNIPSGSVREHGEDGAIGDNMAVQVALDLEPNKGNDEIESAKGRRQPVKYWQFQNTYIFCQVKGDLLIIDQHVAHERILYEKVLKAFTHEPIPVQPCLFPRTLQLSLSEVPVLEEYGDFLKKAGFSLKLFSDRTLIVDGEPSGLLGADPITVLREFIADMTDIPGSAALEKAAATYACKAAIKAGKPLTEIEMAWLVDSLFATEQPFVCPHGRPVIIKMTVDELNKRFGRS
jgi:DNA mismatch repair protein MutL